MPDVINTIIGQSPTIAALIFFIYFLIKEKKTTSIERNNKESLQNEIEKEFRTYLIDSSNQLIKIISKNSEALNRNSKAFEKFSILFEDHSKIKNEKRQ